MNIKNTFIGISSIVALSNLVSGQTFFQATDMRFNSGGWGAVPGGAAGEAYFGSESPGFNVTSSHNYFGNTGSSSAVAFGGTVTTSTILDTRHHLVNDSSPLSPDPRGPADFHVIRRYGAINTTSTYTPGISVGTLSDLSFKYSLRSLTQTGGVPGAATTDDASIPSSLTQSATMRHGFYILATQDGSLYEALVFGVGNFSTSAHDTSNAVDRAFGSLTFNKVGSGGTGGSSLDANGSAINFGYGVEFNTNLAEGENESSIAEVSSYTIESAALIPEPSSSLLCALGGLALLGRRSRK